MKRGFITFVNNHPTYRKLNDILIESVITLTDVDIEVNSINFDFCHSSKKVINKRINLKNEDYENICYAKTYSSLSTDFDVAVQLDSDMIVTRESIDLFDLIDPKENFVLGSIHPLDPNNQQNVMSEYDITSKSQPYIHATYLLTKNSKSFLREVYEMEQHLLRKGIRPHNYDETVLNCALWKHKKINCFVDCYDPFYKCFLHSFTKEKLLYHGYKNPSKVKRTICHGCKDVNLAKSIYETILLEDSV